jgi:predicted secreted hydrolase
MTSNFKPISFPRDGKEHRAIVEWWYFNGHLKDKKGNRYAFMDCLFKADIKRIEAPSFLKKIPFRKRLAGDNPYYCFAHSVISDISKKKNYKEVQNYSLVSRDSFKKPLFFVNYASPNILNGYVNNEIAEKSPFNFHIKTENLDLELEHKKSPLFESGRGFINVCGRESYYYSLTDLRAKGVLNLENKIIEVEGKAWFDHQWTDVSTMEKWSWFSLQLENGTDIMCAEYDDGKNKAYLVDLIYPNGKQEHFNKLLLAPGKDVWKSKKTKAEYPLSFKIEIPEKNMKFEVISTMSDQEMIYGSINYWEGPLDVKGEINGKKVKGVGFMELVGYPSDYSFLLLSAKDLGAKVRSTLSAKLKRRK